MEREDGFKGFHRVVSEWEANKRMPNVVPSFALAHVLRIAGHENVLSETFNSYVPQTEGIGHSIGAAPGDGARCIRRSDNERRDHGVHLIDEPAVKEATEK